MWSLLLLLGVLITDALGFPSQNAIPHELNNLQDIRLIGGEVAEDGEIPWQVSILERNNLFDGCGGSVLNENYIITSANCLYLLSPSQIHVIAGTNNLTGDGGQRIQADKLIRHEHFDTITVTNDIALIHLETPLVLNEKVQPVVLPEQMATVAVGTECIISGWGRTNYLYPIEWPETLMKATVPIVDDDTCRFDHLDFIMIGDSNICAGYEEGGVSTCTGDYGGPMVCDGILYGISSYSDPGATYCGAANKPAIFTEVAYYREWIDAHAV